MRGLKGGWSGGTAEFMLENQHGGETANELVVQIIQLLKA